MAEKPDQRPNEHVAEQMSQLRDEMAHEVADQERRLIDLVTASRIGVSDHSLPRDPRQESTYPRRTGTGHEREGEVESKGPRSVDELMGVLRRDDEVARVMRETGAKPPNERCPVESQSHAQRNVP